MPTFLSRVIALAMIPGLVLEPAAAEFRSSGALVHGLCPEKSFAAEALSLPSGECPHPNHFTEAASSLVAGLLGTASRRQFLRAGAWAAASWVLSAPSPAQIASETRGRVRFHKPLPFPVVIPDYASLPEHVRLKVELVRTRVEQFQDEHYAVNGNNLGLKLSSNGQPQPNTKKEGLALYQEVRNKFFSDLSNALIQDLYAHNELKPAEQAELTAQLQAPSTVGRYYYLYEDFFPAYFARYGLSFVCSDYVLQELLLSRIEIRPVVPPPARIERLLPAWDATHSVAGLRYRLGPSRVRTLYQFNPIFGQDPAMANTRLGTNQMFEPMENSEFVAVAHAKTYADVILHFPEAAVSGKITPQQIPDTLDRARKNLLLRLLRRRLQKPLNQATDEEIRGGITAELLDYVDAHELGHVRQGAPVFPPSWVLDDPQAMTYLEIQADIGAAIGTPFAEFVLQRIISTDEHRVYLTGTGHMNDRAYMANRIAYWYWKTHAGSFAAVPGDPREFIKLPVGVRKAVWERLPEETNEGLWPLFQKAWDELKTSDNPLFRGLDAAAVTLDEPEPQTSVPIPAPAPSLRILIDGGEILGGLAGVSLAAWLVYWLFFGKGRGGGPPTAGTIAGSGRPIVPLPKVPKRSAPKPSRRSLVTDA